MRLLPHPSPPLKHGPEGTVYANGVFKIKIQIPERYPFQPPMVTFATPIYHPNIDNGGRICLDTLNLPPKGSWQPSLNISTVLISIGLLLSEPNPDDGLMHDASREYKYNRQSFDQKARSMTDKYARAGESNSSSGSQDSQTHTSSSTLKAESKVSDASNCVTGSSKKLSLESLGSSSKLDFSKEICKVPNHNYSKSHIESGEHEEAKPIATEFNRNPDKQVTKHKLSLKVPIVSHSGNCESTRTNRPNHCSSILATQNHSTDSPDSLPLVQAGCNHAQASYKYEHFTGRHCMSVNQETQSLESVKTSQRCRRSEDKPQPDVSTTSNETLSSLITSHNKTESHKDATNGSEIGSGSTHVRLKTGVTGRPALLNNEKENLAPNQPSRLKLSRGTILKRGTFPEKGKCYSEKTEKLSLSVAQKLSRMDANLPLEPLNEFTGSKSNNLKLHLESPPNCSSKVLNTRNDAQLDEKQQIHEVRGEESTGEFKQHSAGSPEPEATIVLDSEDSEDENVPARSKLLLARKRLALKRKCIT